MKRRGFLATLAAFFGVGATAWRVVSVSEIVPGMYEVRRERYDGTDREGPQRITLGQWREQNGVSGDARPRGRLLTDEDGDA